MKLPINYNTATWQERKAVREEYARVQDERCYHCGADLDGPPHPDMDKPINKSLFPDGFFKWPLHLHHDHNTGYTIGTVHAHCNAILWQYHGE